MANMFPIGRQYDAGSQICGFLGEWGWQCAGQGAGVTPPYFLQGDGRADFSPSYDGQAEPYQPLDVLDVNQDLSASGVFARYYVSPLSSRSAAFRVEIDAKLPAGVGSGTIYVQIYDVTQAQLLQQKQISLTSSWQTAVLAAQPTSAGAAYWIRVYVVGSRALLGRVRVVPLQCSDSFWTSDFARFQIAPGDLADNSTFGQVGLVADLLDNQHFYADPDSSFSFTTDAEKIFVEVYNTQNQFNNGWVDVLVNGVKWKKIRSASAGYDTLPCSLPAGTKTVTIVNGGQIWNGADLRFVAGSWARAVYWLRANTFQPLPPPASSDVIVLYGNSKLAGFYAGSTGTGQDDNADTMIGGIPSFLRAGMSTGRVVNKAIGSRSLLKDYTAGSNSVMDLARHVLYARPTHIIWEAIRNDWGGPGATAPWANVAAWSAQFKALIDFCNTHSPATQQWLVYTTHETSEVANASGHTLAAFWSELDTIFTDRQTGGAAPYKVPPKKLDLRTLWSSVQAGANTTYCMDGVHPSAFGYGLIGKAIRTALGR